MDIIGSTRLSLDYHGKGEVVSLKVDPQEGFEPSDEI